LFHENDVRRLKEIGVELTKAFAYNHTNDIASISASSEMEGHEIRNTLIECDNLYYMPEKYNDGDVISIDIKLSGEHEISKVVLSENIKIGQRIEKFEILAGANVIYEGQTVGYKKIARFKPIRTDNLKVKIFESRTEPTLSFIGIY
jgi:alpha-L-fucosidase